MNVKFQSLLREENGQVKGPMSPVLFAKEAVKQVGSAMDGLCRVWFDDEQIHNIYEKGEGLTGHDTLLILTRYENCSMIQMFVDEGGPGIPVAMMFTDDEDVIITPQYKKTSYARNLKYKEIQEIMKKAYEGKYFEIKKVGDYRI